METTIRPAPQIHTCATCSGSGRTVGTPANPALAAKLAKATKPEPERTECLCGCGDLAKPKRDFLPGHDQRTKGYLSRASAWYMGDDKERKKIKGETRIPQALVDRMTADPTFETHEYDAETVLMLAEEMGTF